LRPDLAFSPASGAAVAAGPVSVAWTAPTVGAQLVAIVGTGPGDSDVAAEQLLAPGESIDFTFPGGGVRRVHASLWLDVPDDPGGPKTYAYRLSFWLAGQDLAPATVIRRLLGTYWLEEWLGDDLDEKRYCPAAVLGYAGAETTFSLERAADVAPWTPAEAVGVGFALMRLRELDRFDDGITSGSEVAEGEERVVTGEYRLYALDFELAVPSKLQGAEPVEILEARCEAVEGLFRGLAVLPDDSPVISIRNLARYPTRRRGGGDDGTWRRAFVTVQIRARLRKSNVGAKEVALP
jgi:hypothetical protein